MKYFIVEGTITDASKMDDSLMSKHQAYTSEAMERGCYFLSGLKEDMSGGMFIMKANDRSEIEKYLKKEPFYVNGIQTYRITEFTYHYINGQLPDWFCD